jgi:ABC-type Fe3+ transport system substrate-binding protein
MRQVLYAAARAAALFYATAFLLAAPAAAQGGDWRKDWDATVAGAKKEGALTISSPSGREWRDQLLEFQKHYPEIKVSATEAASRDFWPRIIKEREVGQYLWDFRIGGPDVISYKLKEQGHMAPVRPLLLLPEVVEDKNWLGGLDGLFADKEKKFFPGFTAYESANVYYNRKFIPAGIDIRALNEPQWKGKVSLADPRGGAALVTLGVIDKVLGEEFIRRFITDQQPIVTKEPRQQMDWLSIGRYPIAFGLPNIAFVEYEARGAKLDDYQKVRGLNIVSIGVGGIQMPTNSPHPNATKLFVNWILTREVQARLMPALKLNSRRIDVEPGAPDRLIPPGEAHLYEAAQSEEIQPYQQQVADLLRQILKQ